MKGRNSLIYKKLSLFGGRICLELRIYSLGAGEHQELCAALNVFF